ncbi:MAG: histidine kinase [Dehalococcoidia bacterium]
MSTNHSYLAYELRDGLLQDLVAVGLLLEAARRGLRAGDADRDVTAVEAEALLEQAATAIQRDLNTLRSVIDRLRPAA